jgi:ferritin
MKTNRLSKTLSTALNAQMTKEAQASQIYLSYASWAENQGFDGIANFLFRHAEEERNHMMKILEYILKRGAEVHVTSIPAPPGNPVSINNCFEKVFEHEVEKTKDVFKLLKMSFVEEDWATWKFMQCFLKEQIEEETLAKKLLDKLKIAGGEKASNYALYSLDKVLGTTPEILLKQTVVE